MMNEKKRHKKIPRDVLMFNIFGSVVSFVFAMVCAIPFYLIFINSFASEDTLIRNGYEFIPQEFSLAAYKWVLREPARVPYAYRNTICVTIIGTSCSLLMSTMTGYVLSRKDFPWRNFFSLFFFFTTLFSGGLVPWYTLCTRYLGFKNNYIALILPMIFSVWNMIIAKNYIRGLPYEMIESAKVDGANDLLIYFKLILPLTVPLLATLGLFTALGYWNDWYNSMLFITDKNKQSLQYFLHEMLTSSQVLKDLASSGQTEELEYYTLPKDTMRMAITCVTVGPIIFLYPFIQRYFVKGLTIGAVKG